MTSGIRSNRRERATARSPLFRARALALFALCAVLIWAIARHSLVAYLANDAPEWALTLRPDDPAARIALADRQFNDPNVAKAGAAKIRSEAARLAPLVRKALIADPLDARGFRLLGQFADAQDNLDAAEKFMREATRLSLGESVATEWMMRRSFEKKNYAAAAYYADAFLRMRPSLAKYVIPVLGRMAETDKARPYLVSLLKANPPWRLVFFTQIGEGVTDARTPLKLLLDIKDTAAPPAAKEINPYLNFLMQHNFPALAVDVWLQFLPPAELDRVGFLYNGGFELAPSGAPFDWAISTRGGVSATIGPEPERGGSALRVEMGPGRTELLDVTQFVVLGPGTYRLKGMMKGALVGPRGLVWSVYCADPLIVVPPIGVSPMALGDIPDWRPFDVSFTVPDHACPAQILKLSLASRSTSEELATGAISYDDLTLERETAGR